MSLSKFMSIRELIEEAFGRPDQNVVHHKLVQTVLIILARQLRLLERRVAVELGPLYDVASETSLIIREVKLHTTVPKTKKKQKQHPTKASITPADKTYSGKKPRLAGEKLTPVESGEFVIGKQLEPIRSLTEIAPDTIKLTKSTPSKISKKEDFAGKPLPQDVKEILDAAEIKREKELRIIHQRADSREVKDKTPTPIASLDSVEKQYEKLLIVERAPSEAAKAADGAHGKTQRLSVVTLDEFNELAESVKNLQKRLIPPGAPGFPENAQLMEDLRKGASLTDAMAALQLSARLEAAEKALAKMSSLVTELAKITPGVSTQGTKAADEKTQVIYEKGTAAETTTAVSKSRQKSTTKKTIASKQSAESLPASMPPLAKTVSAGQTVDEDAFESQHRPEWITGHDLQEALQEMNEEIMKVIMAATTRSNTNANNALKLVSKLEGKLDESLNLGERMFDLEALVSDYAVQITNLDTGLSSQMTNYQEQLTQMQHDLEIGIETMQEALANTGGDTAAVGELNNQFTSLQLDFDTAAMRQKELKDMQDVLGLDLESLWKQIEILRDTKSDRDEVTDALRDKAGLADLNGLVSRQEFFAVRGDFEKRIGAAYDKFNNQEVIWQRAIDDLLRDLNEKADIIQVVSLQDSTNQYIEKMKNQMNTMLEIVGEPRAAAVSKKIHREAACLSCSSPAHMDLEEKNGIQKLPAFQTSRRSAVGAEAKTLPREDGDHGICYPGLQVSHTIDPRAHICHRYCGGSHTMLNTVSRAPVSMIITPVGREVNTAVGSDGKVYMVDDIRAKKPCLPCNVLETTPEPSEADPAPAPAPETPDHQSVDESSGMTPVDFRQSSIRMSAKPDDVTPPLPIDDVVD